MGEDPLAPLFFSQKGYAPAPDNLSDPLTRIIWAKRMRTIVKGREIQNQKLLLLLEVEDE